MNQAFVREILPARLDGNDKVGHFKTAIVCLLADMFLDNIFNIGWHPNLPCFGLHFGSALKSAQIRWLLEETTSDNTVQLQLVFSHKTSLQLIWQECYETQKCVCQILSTN